MKRKPSGGLIPGFGIEYIKKRSYLHRCSPEIKIIAFLLFFAGILISKGIPSTVILFFADIILIWISRTRAVNILKGIFKISPFIIVILLIQVFAIPSLRSGAIIIWSWRFVVLTDRGLISGYLLLVRFIFLVYLVSIYFLTTTSGQSLKGLYTVLKPLKKFKAPVDDLIMVFTIALRFIPVLIYDTQKLMRAQISRGAEIDSRVKNPLKKAKNLLPLFVPVFVKTIRDSYTLAIAMEARCYGMGPRSFYYRPERNSGDYIFLFFALVVMVAVAGIVASGIDAGCWGLVFKG